MPRIGVGIGIGLPPIVAAAGGYDADAQAFFDRVATAGGTLSTTEKNAVNQLVLDMKSAGIWTSMKAVYPMVGASAAACAQNLVSASFTGTFSSGWTFASTGVTPNGTSAYMDTGLVPSTSLTLNSSHFSYYSRTNSQSDGFLGTAATAALNGSQLYLRGGFYTNKIHAVIGMSIGSTTLQNIIADNTNSQGFYTVKRTSGINSALFKNGVSLATNTVQTVGGYNSFSFYLGARNNQNVVTNYDDRQCAFSSIGDGLTDTQASNFYTAVQTFNQTLNRQVGAQIVSDADAQAYINRVYTAGGTLTNTEANAVNQLVIDMKAAGIWNAMKAVYPMVGASAASCAQNLKSSSFTGTFSSGWTFASTGATPNGTSAYMDTGLTPSSSLSLDSTHISSYIRNSTTGILLGTDNVNRLWIAPNFNGINKYAEINSGTITNPSLTISTAVGFWIGSRTSSTSTKLYNNNSINYSHTGLSVGLDNISIVLSARNTLGGASNFNGGQIALSSIGDGLTDTQAADFYTCVNTFQVSLSRNV